MKQWLAILALLWVTAASQNGEKEHVRFCAAELHAAVIAPDTCRDIPDEDAPLLATAIPVGARHLCSPLSDPSKGNRPQEFQPSLTARQFTSPELRIRHTPIGGAADGDNFPNTRTTERYLYFLHRIII